MRNILKNAKALWAEAKPKVRYAMIGGAILLAVILVNSCSGG